MIHVWMRGTRKLPIVTDEDDKWLALDSLYRMNDRAPVRKRKGTLFPPTPVPIPLEERLVDIVAYCILENHLHLQLLAERGEDVSEFVRRLSISLTAQWRKKTGHTGRLFESTFRRRVLRDAYQERVAFSYIQVKNGAEGAGIDPKTANIDEMIAAAASYKFSSLADHYLGRNLPIVSKGRMTDFFPTISDLRDFASRHPRFAAEPSFEIKEQ